MKTFRNLAFALALFVLAALPSGELLAASHTSKVYTDSNGSRIVVDSGGTFQMNAGATASIAAGGGTGTFKHAGLVSSQFSASGVGNAADTTDDVLFTYSLPASSLNAAGRTIRVSCFGGTAANGNNKTVKLWFGSEVVSSGVVTSNNKNWSASLLIGRTGTSTQMVNGNMLVDTTPITGYVAAGAETETAAITIKCTGASGTTGAANDVLGKGMTVEFLN